MTEPAAPRPRPLSHTIALALSPALAYVAFTSLSFVWPQLAPLGFLVGVLVVPIATIVVLVRLAAHEQATRGPAAMSTPLFVIGFLVLDALIWFGGCTITARNLDTIYDQPKPPAEPPATP